MSFYYVIIIFITAYFWNIACMLRIVLFSYKESNHEEVPCNSRVQDKGLKVVS